MMKRRNWIVLMNQVLLMMVHHLSRVLLLEIHYKATSIEKEVILSFMTDHTFHIKNMEILMHQWSQYNNLFSMDLEQLCSKMKKNVSTVQSQQMIFLNVPRTLNI